MLGCFKHLFGSLVPEIFATPPYRKCVFIQDEVEWIKEQIQHYSEEKQNVFGLQFYTVLLLQFEDYHISASENRHLEARHLANLCIDKTLCNMSPESVWEIVLAPFEEKRDWPRPAVEWIAEVVRKILTCKVNSQRTGRVNMTNVAFNEPTILRAMGSPYQVVQQCATTIILRPSSCSLRPCFHALQQDNIWRLTTIMRDHCDIAKDCLLWVTKLENTHDDFQTILERLMTGPFACDRVFSSIGIAYLSIHTWTTLYGQDKERAHYMTRGNHLIEPLTNIVLQYLVGDKKPNKSIMFITNGTLYGSKTQQTESKQNLTI